MKEIVFEATAGGNRMTDTNEKSKSFFAAAKPSFLSFLFTHFWKVNRPLISSAGAVALTENNR